MGKQVCEEGNFAKIGLKYVTIHTIFWGNNFTKNMCPCNVCEKIHCLVVYSGLVWISVVSYKCKP